MGKTSMNIIGAKAKYRNLSDYVTTEPMRHATCKHYLVKKMDQRTERNAGPGKRDMWSNGHASQVNC